jgi:hypothetical protein
VSPLPSSDAAHAETTSAHAAIHCQSLDRTAYSIN